MNVELQSIDVHLAYFSIVWMI